MLRFKIIKLATASAFIIVVLYAFIAGMGIPVMRATLMAFIFLMALLSGKQYDLYNTLILAALIILVIFPESLFDISFQLSFTSVWAIILIVPRFNKLPQENISVFPYWIQSMIRYVYLTMIVSIAATLGTLPLIMYYFNRISFVTIMANIIAVPLLGTLTLSLSMFFILFSFSTVISGFFVQLASFFTQISINIINKLASLPFSSLSVTKPHAIEIAVFYAMIFMMMQWIDKKKGLTRKWSAFRFTAIKYLLIIALLFFAADITYLMFKDHFSSDLKVTMIDVGQGNSALVQFPGGSNMLIDGGGFSKSTFDVGKSVIAPFLHDKRINRIDTVVLSHPHPDHLLGLIYIMNNFNVRNVWKFDLPIDPIIYPQWEEAIHDNGLNVSLFDSHSPQKTINGVKIDILWPPPNDHHKNINALSQDAVNDSSLVLKITFGEISFLIPGDISADVEKELIQSGTDLKSDVLVVPHHGSRLSSSPEFIKAVGSRYAVVSAGKGNVFKHPHPSVIDRYRLNGTKIFRTDLDGAVFLKTDGKILRTDTYLKREQIFY